VAEGDIKIKITKAGISSKEQTVTVFKKLGYVPDNTVRIGDIVKFGTPTLPSDTTITFARNDGDPIAILPPRTTEPITTISATNPAFERVIATFATPVDLTTITNTRDFRWFDMVWDGFGKEYEFEQESTSGSYTGKRFDLHNVQFQLELTTTEGNTIRFQATSETNTTTGEKNPLRFLKSNIVAPTATNGLTAWGNGHMIKAITLRASGMQLRSPQNNAWPAIGAARNPVIQDTYISSLTVDTQPPPTPKVLYNTTAGWIADIKNPKTGTGDPAANDPSASASIVVSAQDGSQKIIYWDPIDITVPVPYATIVVTTTSAGSAVSWFGWGSISLTATATGVYDDAQRTKNMHWDGIASGGVMRIPLRPTGDTFNEKKFIGFFFQTNHATATDITITEIRLE